MLNSLTQLNVRSLKTPFYYYDLELLKSTLQTLKIESEMHGYHVHYALKANANSKILNLISSYGIGADCVSGNEVQSALDHGFSADQVVFAGVGKTDEEILLALNHEISCFNIESLQELKVLNELAEANNKLAQVAVRINPHVDALTHAHITTGLNENKFGIGMWQLSELINTLKTCKAVSFKGIHFHIGSQITHLDPYIRLCAKINEVLNYLENAGIPVEIINAGGGLGINYTHPDAQPMADFKSFFDVFSTHLKLKAHQELHFELGRSIVGQCGSLVSKVLYVKEGLTKKFAILDAGMTELMRPALYQSYHLIEKLNHTPTEDQLTYDVVGPICETTDCFGKDVNLPEVNRGDYLTIRSAGAYGEAMASQYNLRTKVSSYFSDSQIMND